MIVHYNLLKLTRNADVTEIYFRCRKIYAELELRFPSCTTQKYTAARQHEIPMRIS